MSEILSRLQEALKDRYGIQRELGAGGMATVYLATDLKHDREVAIKVLHPELASTIGPERFAREIQIAAKLQHPNILSLFDSGEADGLLYYVMPFVYGESLRDRLNRENLLPVDFAIRTALEVLDALGYAHSMGIVHRDIKPENIMLSGGHALVADFGIARAVTEAGSEQKLTQTGTAVGTPLYMSPEQAVGDVVGPTADLYSLGCVLYEMLAGTPPFTGPNARAIMARHAMEQVPSLQVVRDTVPDEVEDAIMAALAKVPADRPQTAAQLTEMLSMGLGATGMQWTATRAAQRRTAARTRSTRALDTFDQAQLRRRKLMIGGGIAAATIIAGATIAWALGGRGKGPATGGLDRHHIAVLYFTDQSPKADYGHVADGLTEGLIGALRSVQGLTVVSKGGVQPFRDARVSRDSIARALQVGTLVAGTVEPENDSLRVTIRIFDDAGTELDKATFKKPGGDLVALSDSLADQAAVLIRRRIGAEAELRRTREGTRNGEAWAMYQRAVQARDRGDSLHKAGDRAGYLRQFAAADSLARIAERLDARWTEPIVLLGQLDYWRSRREFDDPGKANLAIDSGLAHAERVLTLDRSNADAYELRGSLLYWRFLYPLESDAARRTQLFTSAQQDLERATQLNPAAASAYAMLAHLYANHPEKSMVDVLTAANTALNLDAYLSNADVVINRLIHGYYDLGQPTESSKWCAEGHRRFPLDPRFVRCELLIMTSKFVANPDPSLAWKLADSTVTLTRDEPGKRYERLYTRVLAAAVLARSGEPDSAQQVLRSVKPDPEVDASNDLAFFASYAWLLAGDTTEALNQLKLYLLTNPDRAPGFRDNPMWWYRGIIEDPRYKAAIGTER